MLFSKKPQAAPAQPAPVPTERVFMGRYRTVRLLGEGGMGKAFLARSIHTGREVVVKVLHEDFLSQPRARESFEREMHSMARFQHPNVVALIDSSFTDPQGPCIVMEYIPGITLAALLRKHRRMRPVRVGPLLGQLCLALDAAHRASIIHRDLTPANLMVVNPDLPGEQLKVMDFGLALMANALYIPVERLANPADFFSASGTPDYICPEQVRGDEMDARGDLYSVGVILYEMLTGRVPFNKPDVNKLLLAHAEDRVPPFAAAGVRDAPAAVETVVMACLAKYPNERPQTARQLCERFEQALGGRPLVDPAEWNRPTAVAPVQHSGVVPNLRRPGAHHVITHTLEAWMPERIAVVKIGGFVTDAGGEVVESVPGMIKVRLRGKADKQQDSGLWSSLGFGKPAARRAPGVEVELHMEKKEASGYQSRLQITVIMRPEDGLRLADPNWRSHCEKVYRDLKAYLISA
jgi:serine/threonine-protein kinase